MSFADSSVCRTHIAGNFKLKCQMVSMVFYLNYKSKQKFDYEKYETDKIKPAKSRININTNN